MSQFITAAEAARALGVNGSRVRQLIAEGRLPAVKFGHIWMIEAASLAGFTRKKRGPNKQAQQPPG